VIRRVVLREEGMALTELLVAAVLMIAVMGIAFGALSQFEQTSNRNTRQNEAQDRARNAIDQVVKRLRNDAAPTPGNPQGIERASATDLIFQSVDPSAPASGSQNTHNVMRVRYCLDDSTPGNGRLYLQTQTWQSATSPPMPSASVCPDPAWSTSRVLTERVVNSDGSTVRPLWRVDCPIGYSDATCAEGTDQGMLSRVKRLGIELFVDEDAEAAPPESRLATGVYFRNQNAAPVATLSDPVSQAGTVSINASASSDPDADRLFYRWCDFGASTPTASGTWCATGTEIPQRTVSISYTPDVPSGTTVTLGVRVQDPGGLVAHAFAPPVVVVK
jgi:type II secretory pathway pseudopilin PulG